MKTAFAAGLFCLLFSSLAWADKSADGTYINFRAEEIAAIMRANGFAAELTRDSYGDPKIISRLNGLPFYVIFFNCEEPARNACEEIQFRTFIDVEGIFPTTLINEWNRDQRFAYAYVDHEGDPVLVMDVDAIGSSDTQIEDSLNWWNVLMPRFYLFLARAGLMG